MARTDERSLYREASGCPPHLFTRAAPKDTMYNVIAAQSTPLSRQHDHGLCDMGTGPGGHSQTHTCAMGISVPGSRKSHFTC